ncbi:unnamed protein product [Rhodiola kirilowii]
MPLEPGKGSILWWYKVGELKFFLGLQVVQEEDGIRIHQQKCLREMITKFGMNDSSAMTTPISPNESLGKEKSSPHIDQTLYRWMTGSFLYISASRPDIMYSVCLCARFQDDPWETHLKAVKRILCYMKGTGTLCLWYPRNADLRLVGYTNTEFTGNKVDQKSTSGMAQFFGSCLLSWASKKQNLVALSTAEAEYITAAACCAQLLWLKQQLSDYSIIFEYVPILGDTNISKNHVHHFRTKHIEIKHHFLCDCVEKGVVSVEFCRTEE